MGGIVNEDVQTAEFRNAPLHQGDAMLFFADIAGNGNAAPSLFPHEFLRALSVLVLAQIREEQVRALPGERNRNRSPDAAVATGDEGHPSFQFVAALIRFLAVVGLRMHIFLVPRRSLKRLGIRRLRMSFFGSATCMVLIFLRFFGDQFASDAKQRDLPAFESQSSKEDLRKFISFSSEASCVWSLQCREAAFPTST